MKTLQSNNFTSALRNFMVRLADCLCICPHRRTTFPITLPAQGALERMRNLGPNTYMVCLDCGRHIKPARTWTRNLQEKPGQP